MRFGDRGAQALWWGAAALLLANGLVLVLLLLPARAERLRQEDQLIDLQRRERALLREVQSSEALLAGFREVEEFTQGYPRQADLVGLLGRLTTLARSLLLDVPSVDYRPTPLKEAGLTKVTVLMGVEGPYSKIRRYLYELETMRRQLAIERLSLRDPKGTSELQVQLQLAVYLR